MNEEREASKVNIAQLDSFSKSTMSTFVNSNCGKVTDLVLRQLSNYWDDIDKEKVASAVPRVLHSMEESFWGLPNKRFFNGENVVFFPYMSIHWMIFLYRLSHELYKNGGATQKEADYCYYLNKIMHANDWFYAIDLPVHFLAEHPLGSVLGRATYGDYLFVYQGTTVGGNRSKGKLCYPVIGNNVILYANASILGNCKIGNNVVIAADTNIVNENVPDNCIVFGKTPNLTIKVKSEVEIKKYTVHIWGWR